MAKTAETAVRAATSEMQLLQAHDAIVREALGAHGGLEVKHTGERNRDTGDALRLRLGISLGGGGTDYVFFRQGSNVVVTKSDGEFVTLLTGRR